MLQGIEIKIDDLKVSISASIGVAIYPEEVDNLEEMIKQADTAMYKAKLAGGNRYQNTDVTS